MRDILFIAIILWLIAYLVVACFVSVSLWA